MVGFRERPWNSSVLVVKRGLWDWNSSRLNVFFSCHPVLNGPSRGQGLSTWDNLQVAQVTSRYDIVYSQSEVGFS